MSEERKVCEVLQSRGVIGHNIRRSREVEAHMAVAVVSLVLAREVTEVGGRSIAGHGAFSHSRKSWRVVHTRFDSDVT